MDISYLLFLQGLREKAGPFVESFFNTITDFPFSPVTILLLATLYWSVEKNLGFFLLFSQASGNYINNIIKNCFCVYRPWIRDGRINPPAKAKAGATGYSFPSGHSQNVMSQYGALGYSLIRKDKEEKSHRWTWAVVLCILIIFIVGFSRNFLSVHTPQDVLTGLCEGLILFILSDKLLSWEKSGEQNGKANRDLIIVITGTVLIIASSLFVKFKSYPQDYVDGVLIVDPYKMQSDYFSGAAAFLALLWGWLWEKRKIHFTTECSLRCKVIRVLIGGAGVGIISIVFSSLIKPLIPSYHLYSILKNFLLYFFAIGLYPLCFTVVEKKIQAKKK